MTEIRRRRNWVKTNVANAGGTFTVCFDDRPAQTPLGRRVELPTNRLAVIISREWENQTGVIDFKVMPFTQLAFGAIDCTASQQRETADRIGEYASCELLCHREAESSELQLRQNQAWEPILDWVAVKFDAPLLVGQGVMPISQPRQSLDNLRNCASRLEEFSLAPFTHMVTLTGSFVLGLAVIHNRLTPNQAWESSRIDEEWQAEKWGRDEQADEIAEVKRREFMVACEFERAARSDTSSI